MNFERIVVLTGAGISQESGIATFRDEGGLWANHKIEDVATPEAFAKNPSKVHAFYNARRKQLENTEPNPAHFALKKLESVYGDRLLVITQNVDNLHESSGQKNLLHMHGSLLELKCTQTQKVFKFNGDCTSNLPCPCCNKPGQLRPNIVWFGEIPIGLDESFEALEKADLFVAIGTSGEVYPAAGFVQHVRMHKNAPCVEINLEPTSLSPLFTKHIYGQASQTVPAFVDQILSNKFTP